MHTKRCYLRSGRAHIHLIRQSCSSSHTFRHIHILAIRKTTATRYQTIGIGSCRYSFFTFPVWNDEAAETCWDTIEPTSPLGGLLMEARLPTLAFSTFRRNRCRLDHSCMHETRDTDWVSVRYVPQGRRRYWSW